MTAPGGLDVRLAQAGPIPLDAAFACAPGEVVALVGPSGSGKSTILRCIAGAYRPRSGEVRVGAATWLDTAAGIRVPAHRRAVGFVFQSYALFPHMTAAGNVAAAMGHVAAGERAARARRLLGLVNLAGLEERRPAELSGGQQQRVAVARALARDPEVLLLDEPFSAVDKATRQRLYREIADLRRTLGMPVVLVTHDLDEATMLADRMAVLHRGRILQTGTPEAVTARPATAEVARLVDMRNVFAGRVVGADGDGVALDWAGLRLRARPHGGAAPGAAVSWAVPDGHVVLHRRDRPSRGERENPVAGTVDSVLRVGQSSQVLMRPDHAPEATLRFSVPFHVGARNGVAPGARCAVSLLEDGIHLMPPSA